MILVPLGTNIFIVPVGTITKSKQVQVMGSEGKRGVFSFSVSVDARCVFGLFVVAALMVPFFKLLELCVRRSE